MKPPEKMTDEELRIEIAEFCGWKVAIEDVYELEGIAPNGEYQKLPNYPQDLNAMWEAEELMFKRNILWQDKYTLSLYNYIDESTAHDVSMSDVCEPHEVTAILAHATAKQRAIAFVKTIREITKK